ncbi:hypothetical protein F5B21DRAFT_503254 [Xylaria acuta]|nr:hypothetical protein F5B21DRAFT_503254 [Xylaria acuta]
MAEIIGFISGAVTIAEVTLRIGETILKLRRLWALVKDVPSYISDLTQKLECLDPSLLEIETIFDANQVEKAPYLELALKRTVTYCRMALDDLNSLVRELNLSIDGHGTRAKATCFRILLKKDTIRKLENRLGSAINMLSLVQQTYLITLTRAQPDIIIRKWLTHTNRNNDLQFPTIANHGVETRQNDPNFKHDNTCESNLSTVLQAHGHSRVSDILTITKPSTRSKITLRAPRCISCKVWEICFTRAVGDWTFRLRSYSTRPSDSQVFQVARSGSPTSLWKLFDTGLASPYDRTIDGRTLFHEAARGLNVGTTRYLMTNCLSAFDTDNYGFYPLTHTLDFECDEKDAEEFVQTIASDHTFGSEFLEFSINDHSMYRNTRKTHSEEISSATLEAEFSRWARNCFSSPWLPRALMQPAWAKDKGHSFEHKAAIVLPINMVAATLGGAICPYPCRKCRSHSFDWETWLSSAKTALQHTPDIHITHSPWICGPEYKRLTALTRLLFHSLNYTTHRRSDQWWERHFLGELRVWLSTLKEEGVDLVDYGRRELEIIHDEETYRDWDVAVSYPRRQDEPYLYYRTPFRLIGFTYGPNPEDWVIYLSEPTDLFAGEFWGAINNPQPKIPGSWVDDY